MADNCAFCGKEVINSKHPYHLDCFDTEIEKQFGINAQFLMISYQDHDWTHNPHYCKICRTPNWIQYAINKGVGEGQRHISRWKLFVGMVKLGWTNEQICKAIVEFNKNCKPPEQDKIIEYHIKYMLEHRSEKDE